MASKDQWIIQSHTEEQEKLCALHRKEKDKVMGPNYWEDMGRQGDTRWCGELLEDALENWLAMNDVNFHRYTHHDDTKRDPFDFLVNGYKVDIKGFVTVKFPREDWACNLPAYHVRAGRTDVIDIYVFSRYNTKTRESYILGWMWADEYVEKGVFRKGGVPITNVFTPRDDFYELPIHQLYPMEKLINII